MKSPSHRIEMPNDGLISRCFVMVGILLFAFSSAFALQQHSRAMTAQESGFNAHVPIVSVEINTGGSVPKTGLQGFVIQLY